ncbi:hypothetical protein F4814DRAFT_407096 [Daldinia grandis]|nr:hypothetical protein F4814DRAFT_407096 [Daldinia grandis]
MDISNSSTDDGPVKKFLDIPYDQRWEYLKADIVHMYIDEENTIKRVSERMRNDYNFDAQIHQYQSHLRKWKIKKRITTKEKNVIISALGKRIRQDGVSTSNVTINQGQGDFAKGVDKKQLMRYINQDIRRSEPLILNPGLFLRHSLPYAALIRRVGGHDVYSPAKSTPHSLDLIINSPPEAVSSSSPADAMSPATQLVQQKILFNRARLFIEGRDRDFIAQLTTDERKSVATWLHDFWIYSFMTVKYWGRGPEAWDLSLINFKSFAGIIPPSPVDPSVNQEFVQSSRRLSIPNSPTQLCQWSIHYETPEYEDIRATIAVPQRSEDRFDIDDESTWTEWPTNGPNRDLTSTLARGLQGNQFSSVEAKELPFATDPIIKAAEKSTDELNADAFGFAIMSRNIGVIDKILDNYDGEFPDSLSAIFPFHLAARYLDGAKTCYLMMLYLVYNLEESCSIGTNYIDDSGFTVLDTLFITILRSHSKVPLDILSGDSASQSHYAGQEVDPCGRWDADSPCVRQLYASGSSEIPHGWKHIFCHTSVQAVCHSLSAIFSVEWNPDINTPSGLFKRRCSCCGLELKLGPLHALVLTAFFLANNGMPGENLFGMICCLVCLLTHQADPHTGVDVSIPELLGRGLANECQHVTMNPAELALKIYLEKTTPWTSQVSRGWKIFLSILQLDRKKDFGNVHLHRRNPDKCSHVPKVTYSNNRQLGQIWAAIQAELLTYRRLSEEDGWLSANFDMEKLWGALEDDNEELLREFADNPDHITGESKLKGYSSCGHFDGAGIPLCAIREEVCNSYYANLDNWERTTFIHR